jgi:energy-coupling factor transporter ATP-binding protein EcfA2
MAQDGGAGQRKRASIAVELLTRPRLLFLDEPTSGLDPSTSEDVLVVLRRLASRGVTVVFTTHDPAEIDACDRVVFLARDGTWPSPGRRPRPGPTSRWTALPASTGSSPGRHHPKSGPPGSPRP